MRRDGESRTIEAQLTISRCSDGTITIRLEDKASRIEFFDGSISPEQFGEAVTGLASRPLTAEVRGMNFIGKRFVFEKRQVVYPGLLWDDREVMSTWLRQNCQEEGWIIDSYLGSQGSVVTRNDKVFLNYGVCKYVEDEE